MGMLTLSVVVPTCQRSTLLAACLRKLHPNVQSLEQDYEVIVSDDSKDAVTEQLLGCEFPWVKYTRGPRAGPAANRNSAARRAAGDVLCFIDDDCVPDEQWLRELLNASVQDGCVLEGRTLPLGTIRSPLEHVPVNATGGYLWSCNFAIRTADFQALGGFDEAFPYAAMEDIDLRRRVLRSGLRVEFVPSAIVFHPPRRVTDIDQLRRACLSSCYLQSKIGMRRPAIADAVVANTRMRVRQIFQYPLHRDVFHAAWLTLREPLAIAQAFRDWDRRGPKALRPLA
jgi:GT2 family glycosyltransferase